MAKRRKIYLHKLHTIIMLVLVSLSGCNANDQVQKGEKMIPINTKEILLSMILKHPYLEQYYHAKLKNRVPVIVKNNGEFETTTNIIMFDVPVQFMKDTKVLPKDTPFFEVQLFQMKDNETIFSLTYDIEGILIKGKIIKEKDTWIFEKYDIIER